jgi:hypothetical protein
MPTAKKIPKEIKIKGTRKPRTKEEKAIKKKLQEEFKYTNNTAKRRPMKTAPAVVMVNPEARTFVPLYASSTYDPTYLDLGYEYLKVCYESFAKREKFYNTNYTDPKTGKLIIPREDMEAKDRYVPFVRLPTILDFIVFCFAEKNILITKEKIETYSETDIEFKNMIALIKTSTESFMQQFPANGQGQSRMFEFLLKNNFGYDKGGEDDGKGTTNNIGIFQQIHMYLKDNNTKPVKDIKATDIDYTLKESYKTITNHGEQPENK